MPMEVGCGAARRQASEAPDQWRTALRRLQGVAGHSGARGLQARGGPEPVGNNQTPDREDCCGGPHGRRQPCSSEHGGLCNQKVYRRSGKAHRHIHRLPGDLRGWQGNRIWIKWCQVYVKVWRRQASSLPARLYHPSNRVLLTRLLKWVCVSVVWSSHWKGIGNIGVRSWSQQCWRATDKSLPRLESHWKQGHKALQRSKVAAREPMYAASAIPAAGRNPRPPSCTGRVACSHTRASGWKPVSSVKEDWTPLSKARRPYKLLLKLKLLNIFIWNILYFGKLNYYLNYIYLGIYIYINLIFNYVIIIL